MTDIEVYCEVCERKVVLRRKVFDHMYHEILCFMILTGIGFLIYLILKYAKKKNTCPHCESVYNLNNLPKEPDVLVNSGLEAENII